MVMMMMKMIDWVVDLSKIGEEINGVHVEGEKEEREGREREIWG